MSDLHSTVPKDMADNLAFRGSLLQSAAAKREVASDIWTACKRDLLFYVNAFGWTYDPRRENGSIPFLTYPFQDELMLDMVECIQTGKDVLVTKSRDMGASWCILTVFEWMWHFRPDLSFLLVSRNEDYVDKPGNPKSLFWKIDFLHKNQPKWLLPNMTRTKLRLTNDDNGSNIDGEWPVVTGVPPSLWTNTRRLSWIRATGHCHLPVMPQTAGSSIRPPQALAGRFLT